MSESKFWSCRFDRAYKEVFLKSGNEDLLKPLLELVLKSKVDKIELKPTELLSGNVNVSAKRIDALIETNGKKIEIEVNSGFKPYLRPRNMAYVCNVYQANTLVGKTYNEDISIVQINLTWGLGKGEVISEYMMKRNDGKAFVRNFKIYEINMDYYEEIWYNGEKEEIDKNKYMIMLGR